MGGAEDATEVLVPKRTTRRKDRFKTPFAPDVIVFCQTLKKRDVAIMGGKRAASAAAVEQLGLERRRKKKKTTKVATQQHEVKETSSEASRGGGVSVVAAAAATTNAPSNPSKSSSAVGTKTKTWDGNWTAAAAANAANAAAASAADAEGSGGAARARPDPSDVLAAHLSAGWKLRAPPSKGVSSAPKHDGGDDKWSFTLKAPTAGGGGGGGSGNKRGGGGGGGGGSRKDDNDAKASAAAAAADDDDVPSDAADGLQPLRVAYGLVPPPTHANAAAAAGCARALGQLCGAVSAARLTVGAVQAKNSVGPIALRAPGFIQTRTLEHQSWFQNVNVPCKDSTLRRYVAGTVLRHRRWCRAAVGAAERAARHVQRLVSTAAAGPLRLRWGCPAVESQLTHTRSLSLKAPGDCDPTLDPMK
jgi:hypothetical protein